MFENISSGLVVDGVVVVEDLMMVCWAEMSGTPGLGLKEFSQVKKFQASHPYLSNVLNDSSHLFNIASNCK